MFFSVIMFVDRVLFLVLHGPFCLLCRFPLKSVINQSNCGGSSNFLTRLQIYYIDFNFVMVEEAKQYLCDTQISALALEIWWFRSAKDWWQIQSSQSPWGIASTRRERNNESSQRRKFNAAWILASGRCVVGCSWLMDEGKITWNYYLKIGCWGPS